jgi:hypothetical protein
MLGRVYGVAIGGLLSGLGSVGSGLPAFVIICALGEGSALAVLTTCVAKRLTRVRWRVGAGYGAIRVADIHRPRDQASRV